MKKLVLLSVLAVLVGCCFQAQAQGIYWEIRQHSTKIDALEAEVTVYMENGYVPLGITYDNVELYLLYISDPGFGAQAWSIEWYEDRNAVQNGMTDNMNQGYVPVGITYTGDLVYVLYIMMESSAEAWALIPSAMNLSAVHDAIQPTIRRGYVPIGITAYEGEYWTLLLRIPDTSAESWMIETYEVGPHGDYIDANLEQGYLPWGMMYDAKSGEIDILYVGF